MKTYAVSLFFRKTVNGIVTTTNERLWQKIIYATSQSEALGQAIIDTDEDFKHYDLCYHIETLITNP